VQTSDIPIKMKRGSFLPQVSTKRPAASTERDFLLRNVEKTSDETETSEKSSSTVRFAMRLYDFWRNW